MELIQTHLKEKRRRQFLEKYKEGEQPTDVSKGYALQARKKVVNYRWHLADIQKSGLLRKTHNRVRTIEEGKMQIDRACNTKYIGVPRNVYYEKKFHDLASKWKEETAGYSTTPLITKNSNYKKIIDLGRKVLPFIFEDLRNEPDYWFVALEQITRKNPVPNNHYGNIIKMSGDWLSWWQTNKKYYLYY